MPNHEPWVRQINAELDGELTLTEAATLARHLASCAMCAGTRVSQIELRVSLARSAGMADARPAQRPRLRAGALTTWLAVSLVAGLIGGWAAHARWGGPGHGPLEATRAAFAVQ